MVTYADIDPRKKAFVFGLDDVLFPQKEYLLQVYYLFANFLEYKELYDAKKVLGTMKETLQNHGAEKVFDTVAEQFNISRNYRYNFDLLHTTARLPVKLALYPQVLALLQDMIVDRKKLFILTNSDPLMQLNKIKQTEWYGLETYLTCYFAEEIKPMPEPDALHYLMKQHGLTRRDITMIGNHETEQLCAEASGVDYISL